MARGARRLLAATGLAGLVGVMLVGQTPNAQAAPLRTPSIEMHVVQAGETLEVIAATYHVSAARLAQVNDLGDGDFVSIGDRLVIPHEPGRVAESADSSVVVNLGDTLDVLAAEHDTTEQAIGQANQIVRADVLTAGQTLVMPYGSADSSNSQVVRLSPDLPLWRAALAVNSNMFAVALANHLPRVLDVTDGNLIRVAAGKEQFSALPAPWVSIRLNTPPLEPGRSAGLDVTVDRPGTLAATFLSRDLHFVSSSNTFSTVIGIDRWAKTGTFPLTITFTDANGGSTTLSRNVLIVNGNYISENLSLSAEALALRSDPQAVADELAYITQKMSGFTPQRYWNGLFSIPTDGILTDAFGSVRSINGGGYDSYHAGNDLAIATGTLIYAPANGVVVDTGLLEERGYATIIDHGMGVYTGYWHQAGILVKPGDKVTAGEQIGVVGNTGSSTASHLHWEMWVGGEPVDALQWVRQVFP